MTGFCDVTLHLTLSTNYDSKDISKEMSFLLQFLK